MWVLVYAVLWMHATLVVCVAGCSLASIVGALKPGKLSACYLLTVVAVVISQLLRGECVLTFLEKYLRGLYLPGTIYRNSFLGHYVPAIPVWVYNSIGPTLMLIGWSRQLYLYWKLRAARTKALPE
jgi:hypothetical protein